MPLLVLYAVLSLVLVVSHGHYGLGPIFGVLATAVVLLTGTARERPSHEQFARALLVLVLVQTTLLTANTQMIYARDAEAGRWMRSELHAIPIAVMIALVLAERRNVWLKRASWVLVAVAAVLGLASKAVVLKASPQPVIDVWTSSVAAVQHLLNGANPYAQQYQDIYAGAYQYKPGMPYGPAFLVWSALWSKLSSSTDVRVGLVIAEVLTAGLLSAFAWRATRTPLLALAVAAVWATNPIGLFVTEQSWIDSLLAAALLASLFAARERRLLWAGIALGFALAVKVYAVVGGGLLFLWVLRREGTTPRAILQSKPARTFVAATVGSAALFIVPFIIASPSAFWHSMVGLQVGQPPRGDALTLTALRAELQGVGPQGLEALSWPFSFLTLALAAVAIWWVWKKVPAPSLFAQGLAAAHVWFFLFSRQAFCNYYYFCLPFIVLAPLLVGSAPDDPTPQPPEDRSAAPATPAG